jgi:hypothetical protein
MATKPIPQKVSSAQDAYETYQAMATKHKQALKTLRSDTDTHITNIKVQAILDRSNASF